MLRLAAALVATLTAGPALNGRPATVLLFISSTCPVSNRYAPDLLKLRDEYAAKGVAFWLVYPDPADTPEDIRSHVAEFKLPGTPFRDVTHELVKRAGATITPEAAVFDANGRMTYRGRIDDRYSAVGIEKAMASRHDLHDAVAATLAGKPIKDNRTQAVGCYIADFLK